MAQKKRENAHKKAQNKEKTESADTDPASAPVRIASLIERSSTTFGVFARFIS